MSQGEEDREQHYVNCARCTNCSKFYCTCHQQMYEQHRDNHLKEEETQKAIHEVVLYEERMQELPTEKCWIHAKKVLDRYCSDCQAPVCAKCFVTDHKGHDILDLEIVHNESLQQCQKEFINIQDTILPQSVEKRKLQRERKETVKRKIAEKRLSMKNSADQIKATVDTILTENNSKLDKMEKSTLDDMKNQERETEEFISHLERLVQIYNSGTLSSKPTEVLKLNKEIGKIKIPNVSEPVTPEFTQGTISKKELEQQFGNISKCDTKRRDGKEILQTPQQSVSKVGHSNIGLSSSTTKIKETKMPHLKQVNHLSPLSHGKVWASDDHGTLVQSSIERETKHNFSTSKSGCGFHTVTSEGELLYTERDKGAIYRVNRNMTITTPISTGDWRPQAIYSSHINGDILVGMSKNEEWKVTRYSKDEEKLWDIQRDAKGRELYHSVWYITENINSDICISDYLAFKVMVVTRSGQYQFSYSGHQSQRGFCPCGICTDVLGHILVCNNYYDFYVYGCDEYYGLNFDDKVFDKKYCIDDFSVHLLDQDGQFLTLLLTPHQCPPNPRALCVDDQHNLWIGCYDSSTVTVYKYLHNKDTNM